MMRRTYWVSLLAIPVAVLAGDVLYWRMITQRLQTGYETWIAARVAEGWQVTSGPLSVGGWPRAATVTVPGMTLRHAGPAVPGDVAAASTGVQLSVSLFDPTSLRISFTGTTHVRANGAPEFALAGDEDWISVPLQNVEAYPIDLHANNLRMGPVNGAWQATAGLLNAHLEVNDQAPNGTARPPAAFWLSAEAIALPSVMKWPLGTNISSLSVDGQLNGPLPGNQGVTQWAEVWRDGGGSLAISHLALGWGPLGVTGSATLALDDQLQPMGSGNGRFVGYAAALDRLAAGGALTKSAATAAKAVLSLMAENTEGDEPSAVDVPLTLQYRTLSMRQVPLVRLPELDWPAR